LVSLVNKTLSPKPQKKNVMEYEIEAIEGSLTPYISVTVLQPQV
jgi:hypothetical protein